MIQAVSDFVAGLHPAVFVAVAVAVAAVGFYLEVRGKEKRVAVKTAREEILKLFLYAEKQEWIGAKKMEFVVEQAYAKFIPQNFQKFIPEETTEAFVLKQYADFKVWLNSEHLEDLIAPKP